jgi:hypothetical protein
VSAVLHDAEAVDASEMFDVVGDDRNAQSQTGTTDPEVVRADQLAAAT